MLKLEIRTYMYIICHALMGIKPRVYMELQYELKCGYLVCFPEIDY